jgi:ribosomal protein S18 acetylase RimI-like enzyme
MESFDFRKVAPEEIDDLYAIYNEVFDWLKAKGVRQWLVRKSRDYFDEFRRGDQLYGLFAGDTLAVFAALVPDKEPHWAGEADIANGTWVHRLTLNPRFRGRGLGAIMVRHLVARAQEDGASHIGLDAIDVNGIMPAYYERLGFRRRKEAFVTYPNGNRFPVVFLDIKLPQPQPASALPRGRPGCEEPKF